MKPAIALFHAILLLVKHGPLRIRTGRSHLMAFVSQYDGLTWSRGLLLDQREGVSYPDGQETEDDILHIVYNRDRTGDREVLLTTFTEEAIWRSAYDEKMVEIARARKTISSKPRGE
ncbi:sialidase family protein [Cyclobacterium jeungdonense]|uniref:Sialidase family protein n=1 Tax=Cyclobacterium jeungdonense TaxID=708087 RepID=A0ABT8CB09_9BACT|nr:sialidase family protein [Cyclobacterium jeungdonense]MDN3688950.1 sialidase family protein [Cyclobacterium jeungdonense]